MTPTTLTPSVQRHTFRVTSDGLKNLRVHLIGIGGSGMSGLAALLMRREACVSGSDRIVSPELAPLAAAGAVISTQQTEASLPADTEVVVRSAAIPDHHPELAAARARNIPIVKYAEMLGRLMAHFDGIAISGTHGKSTTTAWLAYTLRHAGLDPSFVIGASVGQLGGGSGVGNGPHFIAEACEYDRSFLNLCPRRAVVLNIEEDHLDYYRDIADIESAFTEFVTRVPADGQVVLNADDLRARRLARAAAAPVTWFGRHSEADWRPGTLILEDGTPAFDVLHRGERLGRVHLALAGEHNVMNALAVAAAAHTCGVPWDALAAGLQGFTGANRRLETRAELRGIRIVDDYAHHPTELRVTLQAARERFAPRRLWVVFQPHQHSRTRFLLADFARSFTQADHVLVPDIYFVRDTERDRQSVSAPDLVARIREHGGDAEYIPDFPAIVARLADALAPGDVVLTMGAGPIWKVADELVQRLRGHLPG